MKPYRIALLFLVTQDLKQDDLWQLWIKGNEDRVNYYAHISPEYRAQLNPNGLIYNCAASKGVSIPTGRTNVSLIKAVQIMLFDAYSDVRNKYFIILSESDIPFRSFDYVYDRLFSSPKGRMHYDVLDRNTLDDIFPDSKPSVFPKKGDALQSVQWFILNRELAWQFRKIPVKVLKNYDREQNSAKPGNERLAPNELLFINYLKYYEKYKLSKEIINEYTTRVLYKNSSHPIEYKAFTSKMSRDLETFPSLLFARKFSDDKKTTESLLKNLPWVREQTAIPKSIKARIAMGLPTLGNGIRIDTSGIPNSGKGVFADQKFKKGDIITWYDGEVITATEANKRKKAGNGAYLRTLLSHHSAIDGYQVAKKGIGLAQLANDAGAPNTPAGFVNNAYFFPWENSDTGQKYILLRAKTDIKKGEEVFASYKNGYWK